jgi:hypothetical protein
MTVMLLDNALYRLWIAAERVCESAAIMVAMVS